MLLPLIRRRQNNIVIVEFADLDLTDYNAPILGSAAPRDARAARALWRSLLSALHRMPDAADLVRLRKVPVDLDGKPNPLALLGAAGPCSLNGNLVTTGEDYDAWRYTLEKTVRKELERSWRVFTREPAASFAIITDADEALRILSATEVQQGTRMQSLGLNYVLNDETCAAFYRNLVCDGVGNGYALVSALTVGDEVVATLLGIRTGSRYVMIRISNAGEKWSNCSPGRLDHRAHHGSPAQGRRARVRLLGRQLCLQAPLRCDTVAADRHQRRLELARMAPRLRDHMVRAVRNYPRARCLAETRAR